MANDSQIRRIENALTSFRREFIYRDSQSAPRHLIEALTRELPHIPSESWSERLKIGGVYVNGYPIKEDLTLPPVPFRIEYYEPKDGAHEKLHTKLDTAWIIYEDKEFIAINKPSGLSCNQAREQHTSNLKKLIESHVGRKAHLPSRLDTSAQGLVVVSIAPRTHKLLQQVYERHQVEKYYLLAVSPPVLWRTKLVKNRIDRDPRHSVLRRVVDQGGDEAITFFTKIDDLTVNAAPCSIVLAKPQTGRTHQLRVQMANLGSPIVGDNFYSGINASELHLLSIKIKFFDRQNDGFREFKLRPSDLPGWCKPEWIV